MALRSSENLEQPSHAFRAERSCDSGSCSDENCHLGRLAATGDFNRLLNLLYSCVWQRFSLTSDEYPLEAADDCNGQTSKAQKNISECQFGASFDLSPDKENVYTSAYVDKLRKKSQSESEKHGQQIMEWEFECDPETMKPNYPFTEVTEGGKVNMTAYYPVPAWFLLSAVFTGCPQLIDHLLDLQNRSIAPEKFEITEVCLGADQSDTVLSNVQESQKMEVTVQSSVNTTTKAMKISNQMAEVDVRKLRARRFGYHSFVDAKVACEFPITDTWIHQSINLMISPLHLACWRLDFNAIRTLLQHGANPNGLALEQVPREMHALLSRLDTHRDERPSPELMQHSPYFLYNGLYFYHNRGLSPLHFIALGLRSPPRHSVTEGCRAGIIHDSCAAFQELQRRETIGQCSTTGNKIQVPCLMLNLHGLSELEETDEQSVMCALVVNCLEMLLQAGAKSNVGENSILQGAYPMDIVLQPPYKVYYAPNAARGTQSSSSLRRFDLEHNVSYVIAASDALLRYNAKVSPNFASTFAWRPELLDCFHLNDKHSSIQLVSQLIRLGLFSDTFSDDTRRDLHHRVPTDLMSVKASAMIQRFIADIMNKSVPASLAALILHWCSLPVLHDVSKIITKIAESSGWSDSLRELANVTSDAQHRSLKHHCNFVILKSVGFSFAGKWADNIAEWTKMSFPTTQTLAHNRHKWSQLVQRSSPQRPYDPGGLWDQ